MKSLKHIFSYILFLAMVPFGILGFTANLAWEGIYGGWWLGKKFVNYLGEE